jgi:hypothetical protein
MVGKGSRKQVESAIMPSSNKQKCYNYATCERKDKDILEKDSRKPVELPMPSPNKQHSENKYEAAPARRNEKVEIQVNPTNAQAVPDGIGQQYDENSRKHQSEKCYEKEHLEKPASSGDTKRRNIPKDVKVNRKDGHPSERELMEAVELDLDGLPKQGTIAAKFPETGNNKVVQPSAKPKETVKEHHIEKENKEALRYHYHHRPRMPGDAKPKETVKEHHIEKENKEALRYHHRPCMPGGADHNGRRAESTLRAQDLENKGSPVTPSNGNTRNKGPPPYTKLNGANMKNHIEKQTNNGFLNDRPQHAVDLKQPVQKGQGVTSFLNDGPQHLADLGHLVQKGQGVTEMAVNMRPPYVKPKFNIQPVNGKPEKQSPKDYSQHNIPRQAEQLVVSDVPRPVSVRRRNAKPPTPVDAYSDVPNKEKVTSQTPGSHRRHASRNNGADPDHNGNITDSVVGNGKNVQRTPSSHPKHTGRRNGTSNHNNDYDGFMQCCSQPKEDAAAIDFGNLLPQHASAQRRHKSGRLGDSDEEERMMDKLLMHYSKKGLDQTNKTVDDNEAKADSQQMVSLHPHGRAISLPPASVGPGEDVKVPARSTSLQPAVRVHPKMPDFDQLAARVNALSRPKIPSVRSRCAVPTGD